MLGTEYKWLTIESLPFWEVALRAGYANQQTQMPDFGFDPGSPSADVNIVGGGAGLVCKGEGKFFGFIPCGELGVGAVKTKLIGLDLSYQAALYEERTISGNRNPTVNGLYKTTLHTGGVSIRVAF
jgi:long-chain fatty acid transport protein